MEEHMGGFDPRAFAEQGRRQRQEERPAGRWVLSMIVGSAVGMLAGLLAGAVFALGAAILGLDGTGLMDVAGPMIMVGTGAAVTLLCWRGIRARWNRPPRIPPSGWGAR
jgi:hypothetical protein